MTLTEVMVAAADITIQVPLIMESIMARTITVLTIMDHLVMMADHLVGIAADAVAAEIDKLQV
jgi:hypothetical protein